MYFVIWSTTNTIAEMVRPKRSIAGAYGGPARRLQGAPLSRCFCRGRFGFAAFWAMLAPCGALP
jgi:hypothetical protein